MFNPQNIKKNQVKTDIGTIYTVDTAIHFNRTFCFLQILKVAATAIQISDQIIVVRLVFFLPSLQFGQHSGKSAFNFFVFKFQLIPNKVKGQGKDQNICTDCMMELHLQIKLLLYNFAANAEKNLGFFDLSISMLCYNIYLILSIKQKPITSF